MSFSHPPPAKAARALSRTGSYISLADMQCLHAPAKPAHRHDPLALAAYTRIPRQNREPRERRKNTARRSPSVERITIAPKAKAAPPPSTMSLSLRTSPAPHIVPAPPRCAPPRTHFPRAKHEPDLYRIAITTRMRMSPEGQKILHMGPRLALSIYSATRELEQIVAAQRDADGDVDMRDPDARRAASWVAVGADDWEMVDCAA